MRKPLYLLACSESFDGALLGFFLVFSPSSRSHAGMSTGSQTSPCCSDCVTNNLQNISNISSLSKCANPPGIVVLAMKAAGLLGYSCEIVDRDYGFLFKMNNGKQTRYFIGGLSPLNDAVATRLAQDKYYTSMILAENGFRTPLTARCIKPDYFSDRQLITIEGMTAAEQFCAQHPYPLIVKPNRMSLGRDVVSVYDEASLTAAVRKVWQADYIALVQKVAEGTDVRLDFLDGAFLAGYRRKPITIQGDGKHTLEQLLQRYDSRFCSSEFMQRRTTDPIWKQVVTDQGYRLDSVIAHGRSVSFDTPVLNLNRWCTAEVLQDIPTEWLKFCLDIGKYMNLRHFGIDLRVPTSGLSEHWHKQDPAQTVIIEVNASPALVQLHDLGFQQQAVEGQAKVFRALFGS